MTTGNSCIHEGKLGEIPDMYNTKGAQLTYIYTHIEMLCSRHQGQLLSPQHNEHAIYALFDDSQQVEYTLSPTVQETMSQYSIVVK